MKNVVAVGTAVARRPPHGSRRAELPHRALALDHDAQAGLGVGVTDTRSGKPARGEAGHPLFADPSLLTAPVQHALPEPPHTIPE